MGLIRSAKRHSGGEKKATPAPRQILVVTLADKNPETQTPERGKRTIPDFRRGVEERDGTGKVVISNLLRYRKEGKEDKQFAGKKKSPAGRRSAPILGR